MLLFLAHSDIVFCVRVWRGTGHFPGNTSISRQTYQHQMPCHRTSSFCL